MSFDLTILELSLRVTLPIAVASSFCTFQAKLEPIALFDSPDTSMAPVSLLRYVNPLKPNDPYRGRPAPLTSKRCILCIYSSNIGTEYFKHGIYSPLFSLQNAVCFIILFGSCIIHILYTGCAKIKKKIIPAPKG